MYSFSLVVITLTCVLFVNSNATIEPCPACINTCPEPGCDCTAADGNVLKAKPGPLQPPRPEGCAECIANCPLFKCVAPPPECSVAQLQSYVRKCPPCDSQAGCQQIGCDCTTSQGNVLTPPTNALQSPLPFGCPACDPVECPLVKCPAAAQCTDDQLDTYVPKCDACIPQAGCQQIACECLDCEGNILKPPRNPPQPPRQPGCAACETKCRINNIRCAAPSQCSDKQLATYVIR